jgi:hypothetical protein
LENEMTLYIAMRLDIPDMNPGKAMAQAAHAQALFDLYDHGHKGILEEYCEWRGDGENCLGFGRTLVVQMTKDQIFWYRKFISHNGLVVDPTYPYNNGRGEIFTMEILTAAWFFPINIGERQIAKQWELHP